MTTWPAPAWPCPARPRRWRPGPDVYFTTSHVDGVPIVQGRLEALDEQSLTELVGEAWAARAH